MWSRSTLDIVLKKQLYVHWLWFRTHPSCCLPGIDMLSCVTNYKLGCDGGDSSGPQGGRQARNYRKGLGGGSGIVPGGVKTVSDTVSDILK